MPFKKGQSGNPKGRPEGKRAFTRILVDRGNLNAVIGGEVLTAKDALAARIWEFVTTGRVTFGDEVLKAETTAEWFTAARWIYFQIDGPAKFDDDSGRNVIVNVVKKRKPLPNESR
jgi:hypothetical protein